MSGGFESRERNRIFQWLLTLGFVVAALIGLYFSSHVEEVAKLGDPKNYWR
ncbi:MAG: hypothetical protein WDN00_17290 [Limisphaerales bacterium]